MDGDENLQGHRIDFLHYKILVFLKSLELVKAMVKALGVS